MSESSLELDRPLSFINLNNPPYCFHADDKKLPYSSYADGFQPTFNLVMPYFYRSYTVLYMHGQSTAETRWKYGKNRAKRICIWTAYHGHQRDLPSAYKKNRIKVEGKSETDKKSHQG
jgi:hypothetical protein